MNAHDEEEMIRQYFDFVLHEYGIAETAWSWLSRSFENGLFIILKN